MAILAGGGNTGWNPTSMVAGGSDHRARAPRLGRIGFGIGLALACGVWWLGLTLSERALPAMARLSNPHGLNAGLALNAIWIVLDLAFVTAVVRLLSARLRDLDWSTLPAYVTGALLIAGAILTDQVFLWRRYLPLPAGLDQALVRAGLGVIAALVFSCLVLPGTNGARRR